MCPMPSIGRRSSWPSRAPSSATGISPRVAACSPRRPDRTTPCGPVSASTASCPRVSSIDVTCSDAAAALRPVMSLHARPVRVIDLPAGHGISYGARWVTARPSRIATLPVGYADGFSRIRTNRSEALVRGVRVPLVGTVAMDAVMADVTDVPRAPVTVDDEFVLLGEQGSERITAADLARIGTTISWEVLASMARRLPRVYYAASGSDRPLLDAHGGTARVSGRPHRIPTTRSTRMSLPRDLAGEQLEELVERAAREIQLRGLTAPAVHFLQASRPYRPLGANAMLFFDPVLFTAACSGAMMSRPRTKRDHGRRRWHRAAHRATRGAGRRDDLGRLILRPMRSRSSRLDFGERVPGRRGGWLIDPWSDDPTSRPRLSE